MQYEIKLRDFRGGGREREVHFKKRISLRTCEGSGILSDIQVTYTSPDIETFMNSWEKKMIHQN